jgi:hypothetical protein
MRVAPALAGGLESRIRNARDGASRRRANGRCVSARRPLPSLVGGAARRSDVFFMCDARSKKWGWVMSVVEDTTRLLYALVAFERGTQPASMETLGRALGWRAERLEAALDCGEAHGWIRSLASLPSTTRERVMMRDGGRRIVDDVDMVARWASAAAGSRSTSPPRARPHADLLRLQLTRRSDPPGPGPPRRQWRAGGS